MYATPNACAVNESEYLAMVMSQAVASPRLVSLSDHWPFFLSGVPSSHALLASAASLLIL